MQSVNVLMKPVSGMCNMYCDYCFYCDEMKHRSEGSYGMMSEETLKNVIRRTELGADRAVGFAYQGGEPTLRGLDFYRKALEYQRKYNQKNLIIHNAIQTNGILIDEEWCRFFRDNHFLVGLSVDGLRETHDRYRHNRDGTGTYDAVCRAAKLFDRFGVEYNILTVVTKETAVRIQEIYQQYQQKGWNYQQYIVCLDPLGKERGTEEYSVTPELYGNFLVTLFDLWYQDWKRGEEPYIRHLDNYIGILMGYPPEACEQCGVCGIQNVVEADGRVYPCDFYMLDEYQLGNLNRDRLKVIEERRQQLGFIQASRTIPADCGSCRWLRLCRGGCRRNRLQEESGGYGKNYFCESYQQLFRERYQQMETVAREWGKRRRG